VSARPSLKHVTRFEYGDALAQEIRIDGEIPVFGSNGVVGTHVEANMCGPAIVIGRKGSYGKVTWTDNPGFCIDTAFFVDTRSTSANLRWLYWALQTLGLDEHSEDTGVPGLSREKAYQSKLLFPPTADQERIANFLDDKTARIDALIAEKERLAESLKDIEEVTAFDMVTRGLGSNANRTSFVEPWLGEVPLHWGLAKIRNIATVGNGSTPKRDNEDYWSEGETPWLNSGSVNSPRIVDASDYVTPLAIKECHLPTVRAGSTVVALTGQGKTRGRAAFAEFETTINQHLAYISVVGEKVSDEYLWVALTGFYSVFRYISDGEGSTKGALTCEELNKFRLPIPPPEEQAQIVTEYLQRIKSIDTLKEHNELHLARLREYRSSLISAAVTGQLDFNTYKGAAADPH